VAISQTGNFELDMVNLPIFLKFRPCFASLKGSRAPYARWPSCDNLLARWSLAMTSLDKMLGWFPHNATEWIELIIVAVLLWLLMMTIFELELSSIS
jgi:hypothetical protein